MTQNATEAARSATLKAIADNNRYLYRFLVANARRFFSEVRVYLNMGAWDKAAMRLGDVAEQAGQLANLDFEEGVVPPAQWSEVTTECRKWADTCQIRASKPTSRKFAMDKWQEFVLRIEAVFDTHHSVFASVHVEHRNDPRIKDA